MRCAYVGWLDGAHPYAQGSIDQFFLDRLWMFVELNAHTYGLFNWGARGGVHTCELCENHIGAGQIGVLGEDVLYIAPTMITHYVEKHRYSPPAEFIDAVMQSPLPGTKAYTNLIGARTEAAMARNAD
jgi:hypothetical protein